MLTARTLTALLVVSVAVVSEAAVYRRQSRATCPIVTTKPDFNYIPVTLDHNCLLTELYIIIHFLLLTTEIVRWFVVRDPTF